MVRRHRHCNFVIGFTNLALADRANPSIYAPGCPATCSYMRFDSEMRCRAVGLGTINVRLSESTSRLNRATADYEFGRLAIRESSSLIASPTSRGNTMLYDVAPLYALSADPIVSDQGS